MFEGGEISIYYDPMIAKLVTHAPTRLAAIDAQARALDAFAIDGIRHNIPFLSTLMQHPRWREGELSTGFIAEEFPEGFSNPAPVGEVAARIATVATAIDHLFNRRKRDISGQLPTATPVRFEQERVAMLDAAPHPASVADGPDGTVLVTPKGAARAIEVRSDWKPGDPVWAGTLDGAPLTMQVRPILNGVLIAHAGTHAAARVYTAREAELAALMPEKQAADTGKLLLCPMPGLVKQIAVSLGQEVKAGEPLAIVEAMKMENVLRAERDGTVSKIHAKEGDSLAVDAVILEFA